MIDPITFQWDTHEFNAGLDKLWEVAVVAVMTEVFLAGEALRKDSTDIVPFQRGFNGGLAGSSSTQPTVEEAIALFSATVGYNEPYAARLHEDLTLNISQKHTAAGQTRQQKYLEKPAKENAQKYGTMIREGVFKAMDNA